MKMMLGIIFLTSGLLAGCGASTNSKNALTVNEYTQSDIGTYLERVGCELSTHNRGNQKIEITVKKCSSISNHDAIRYIKENLVDTRKTTKPLIYFKSGR
jgi:outer membrane PBP1 activator LpoA protein